MSKILETDHYFKTIGKHSEGPWKIEISKKKDHLFTEGKIQMRFEDTDNGMFINMKIDELISLKEMIQKVIKINS